MKATVYLVVITAADYTVAKFCNFRLQAKIRNQFPASQDSSYKSLLFFIIFQ